MGEKRPFKILAEPKLQGSSLVVAWSEDAGKLGPKVVDYLNKKLQGEIAKQKQAENVLKQDRNQLEQHLREQIAKLRVANEQLQHEIAKREQVEEQLASVQSRLDNINLIVHKHL